MRMRIPQRNAKTVLNLASLFPRTRRAAAPIFHAVKGPSIATSILAHRASPAHQEQTSAWCGSLVHVTITCALLAPLMPTTTLPLIASRCVLLAPTSPQGHLAAVLRLSVRAAHPMKTPTRPRPARRARSLDCMCLPIRQAAVPPSTAAWARWTATCAHPHPAPRAMQASTLAARACMAPAPRTPATPGPSAPMAILPTAALLARPVAMCRPGPVAHAHPSYVWQARPTRTTAAPPPAPRAAAAALTPP